MYEVKYISGVTGEEVVLTIESLSRLSDLIRTIDTFDGELISIISMENKGA